MRYVVTKDGTERQMSKEELRALSVSLCETAPEKRRESMVAISQVIGNLHERGYRIKTITARV